MGWRDGQARTAWLNNVLQRYVGDPVDYYLGPTGIPQRVNALTQAAQFTDAGDYAEAVDASRSVWNDPTLANVLRYGTAAGALAIPMVSARMMQDGVDVAGDAARSMSDDAGRFWRDEDGAFNTNYLINRYADNPPKSLRERYSSGLSDAAATPKNPYPDVRRIKLTPERIERAKEYYSKPRWQSLGFSSPEEYGEYIATPPRQHVADARAFADAAARSGERVRFKMPDGPSGSLYVRVGDKGTVRFSDHAQPKDWVGGERVTVGGYSSALGRRHHPATISVDPQSGVTLDDAIAELLDGGDITDPAVARADEEARRMRELLEYLNQ